MPQRKDKQDKCGQPEAFLELLSLLDTPEPETAESVKNMIQENLSNCKDPKLLNTLVNFYMTTQSKSCFEVLLHLRDPLDKQLFEKINELMKSGSSRYSSLQLLGNLVYRQPTWLYKIANQPLMHTLLEVLKTDLNSPNLLNALFILICLLPMIPHLFGSLLLETFNIFSRLAAWNVKKPNSLSDVLNLHLQTGVYSLFHRLYGMFPCNFLAYLRSFYGGRDSSEENNKVFSSVIKPMLERVRLHPLLVTASKETELNVNRWKRMAYHDIIVECASISLDTIEGTFENHKKLHSSTSVNSEKFSSYESSGSAHIGCQTNIALAASICGGTNDMSLSNDNIWTPSQSCFDTSSHSSNLPSPSALKGDFDFKNAMQSSTEDCIPLDFAVEAKPGFLKDEMSEKPPLKGFLDSDEISFDGELLNVSTRVMTETNTHSDLAANSDMKSSLSNDLKEADMDKEVSNLTSSETLAQSFISEVRQDTPFCSTTLTLTDEPINLSQLNMSSIDKSHNFVRNNDHEESNNNAQYANLQSGVNNLSLYPYFNNQEHSSTIKIPKIIRSISCPSLYSDALLKNCNKTMDIEPAYRSLNITTTSAFETMNVTNSIIQKDSYPIFQKLLPSVMNPVQAFDQTIIFGFAHIPQQAQNIRYLSPPELLDHYIQQSSSAYLANLPLTAKTDTDWTHFGGKPPEDEIDTLRNQILLLHTMLLFERHRKDIHSERNRRILGRAKKIRMQEECVTALKSDITTLKEENSSLRKELSNQYKINQQLHLHKKQIKEELDTKIFKCCQENQSLLFSCKQIQSLLVTQKGENDEIRDACKKAEKDVAAYKCQLKYAKQEILNCQKIKKEAIFLSKQLIMLQELNSQYKNKIEKMKIVPSSVQAKILKDSMNAELKDIKEKLEMQTVLLDSSKGRIAELENTISLMNLKEKEKAAMCDTMKNFHQAEVKVREDRLKDLEKITLEKDAHILKLYTEIDRINEKNSTTEIHREMPNDSNCSDNGLQPLHQQSCDSSGTHRKEEIVS